MTNTNIITKCKLIRMSKYTILWRRGVVNIQNNIHNFLYFIKPIYWYIQMNYYSIIEKTNTMLADYHQYFSDLTINYVISFSKELMQKIKFQLLQLTLLLTSRNAICVLLRAMHYCMQISNITFCSYLIDYLTEWRVQLHVQWV